MAVFKDQHGVAHLALILIGVVVVGAIGFAGYKVVTGQKNAVTDIATEKVIQEAAKVDCDKINDDDLCKFYTNWKTHKQYRMVSSDENGTLTLEIDGDNSHMVSTGELATETITIGSDMYVKSGSTWYKQATKKDAPSPATADDYKVEFDEPATEQNPQSNDKSVYKKLGKEACGSLQCFKYEIVDSSKAELKQYIWFDDKDYQLRKSRTENGGKVSEQTFEYNNVSIKAPSPVTELAPNQYIVPGQTEPVTIPES